MGSLENVMGRQDTAPLLQSLKEGRVLEKWQQRFCGVANVFICCMDNNGLPLTEFGGKEEEVAGIKRVIDEEQVQSMLLRVSESMLEDQAVETTAYPNLRLAVISARLNGEPVINWLVCGVLSDAENIEEYENPPLEGFTSVIGEKQFSKAVDTLRDMTDALLKERLTAISAEAESRRSRLLEKEMSENLKRSEKLNEIAQFLENGESVESVVQKLLKTVGSFLNLSVAALYRIPEEEEPEIVSMWCGKDMALEFTRDGDSICPSVLKVEKTQVLSSNSMMSVIERAEMQALGFKALIVIPMAVEGTADRLYICFGEKEKSRVWELEEIKFLNDSARTLQSVITKYMQKDSLTSAYASIEAILNNVGFALYVQDAKTHVMIFANEDMRHTFAGELRDGSINEFIDRSIQEKDGGREVYYAKKERWYELYYAKIRWVDRSPAFLCTLYDVTEKMIYQKKIEQQAYTDFLTGLNNRMCCERDAARYVDEARAGLARGALLYLDMDDFKKVNDGLGHQYGDVLLKDVSQSISQVKGIENTCYRMGGDEFVIIVPPDEYKNLEKIISAVKEIFRRPWFLKDADYYCTISMGVAEFPVEGDTVHDLIKKADIAMYKAKKQGKNQIVRYFDNTISEPEKHLDMEKNMRDAIKKGYGEFEIYFQPMINFQAKELPCVGAEALVRWNRAGHGLLPPSEFLPMAEYLGLINPLGSHVLRQACGCCKAWNDNGYPDYKISVNLSMVQLMQPDILKIIRKTLKDTGMEPGNLILEVTENLAVNDMERMKKVLKGIKKLGVKVALDDFGVGYSSLTHIREIPLDMIKVDPGFIKNLEKDAFTRTFIKMMGELAETIGVRLCVEGVETRRQYEALSELSVSLVQGYYFDRPLTKDAFEKKYAPDILR